MNMAIMALCEACQTAAGVIAGNRTLEERPDCIGQRSS